MTLKGVLATVIVSAGVLGLVRCTAPLKAATQTEILRVVSPDSIVDAVVTRNSAGATTSNVFRIFVVPRGQPVPSDERLERFRADKVSSLCVEWRRPRLLELRYDRARIFRFTNFWNSRDVQQFQYVVELRLEALNPTSSLLDPGTEPAVPFRCAHELNS